MPTLVALFFFWVAALARATTCAASIPDWVERRNPSAMFEVEYARNVAAVQRIDAKSKPADVLVYGDSITAWNKPMDLSKLPGSRKYFEQHFGDLVSEPLGIPGDEVKHLFWRIARGKELPIRDPKHLIIFIGINDITHGVPEGEVVSRMGELLSFVTRRLPTSKVLLQLLLPSHAKVPTVNEGYVKAAKKLKNNGKRVEVVECLTDGLVRGSDEWRELMVDQLHPSELGQDALLRCWRRHVDSASTCRAPKGPF